MQLPADLAADVAGWTPEEREVLERLAGERPVGHLPDSPSDGGRTPARRLLQRGLLARIDALNVELPREIGLHLRGDRPYGPPRLRPEPAVTAHEQGSVDRRAAGAALESVGRIGELLTLLEEEPAGLLRSGGVGVRDQKRLARVLHVGEPDAAWLLELAYAAGLLDVGGPHRDEWLPTRAYDIWREQDLADRWAVLAAGWLSGVRLPSLVGQRDVAGKAVNPLSPDLVRHTAPAIRRSALTVLAEYPPGAGLAPDDLVSLLRWRTPRRADRLAPVPAMLAEAARLGVLVGGVLSTAGRGLLTRGEDGAADGMRGLLPEPVDHVLAQPDLSLIAPGPLVSELADTLAVVADVESSGGATVFRVSESSVRRALDAGWSAADLHDFFTRVVPDAGAAGAGLPGRRRRPPARPAAGRLDRVLRALRRPRPALPGAQRPSGRLGRAAPPGARRPGQRAGRRRGADRAARRGLLPRRGEPGRRRPHPAAGPAARRGTAARHRALARARGR